MQFLTPPVDWDDEVRCFFRDLAGHLFEISEFRVWRDVVTGISIREAQAADIAALVALNDEVHDIHLRLFPDIFKPMDPAALAEWFGRLIDDDKMVILVAVDASKLVASLVLRKDERPAHLFTHDRRCAYIDQVCVTERYRRKGIFQALLSKAETIAREWGMSRLELDVWSDNAAAKKAFSRCGFQTYNEKMKLLIGE